MYVQKSSRKSSHRLLWTNSRDRSYGCGLHSVEVTALKFQQLSVVSRALHGRCDRGICFCTAAAQDTQSDGCVRAMTPTNNVTARAALVGAVSPGWNVLRTLGEELVCFSCFVPGNEGLDRYFAGVLRLGHDDIVCC